MYRGVHYYKFLETATSTSATVGQTVVICYILGTFDYAHPKKGSVVPKMERKRTFANQFSESEPILGKIEEIRTIATYLIKNRNIFL